MITPSDEFRYKQSSICTVTVVKVDSSTKVS